MRTNVIAGNWKMNTDMESAARLTDAIIQALGSGPSVQGTTVVLCPPFPLIHTVREHSAGSSFLRLGAQTMHNKPSGAYTGEVSAAMLKSVGCEYVILGHSERRLMFAESDLDVCYRVNAALAAGIKPIICVGETSAERESDRTRQVIERQVRAAFDGTFEFNVRNCIVAYEPMWAVGTDNSATPEQAQEVHTHIRGLLASIYGAAVAPDISIIYGGSVKRANAAALFAQPDVDGGLIGGASLDAGEFTAIIRAVPTAVTP